MTKELTGRHVLIIAITAFATIIAANMTMLFAATGSFPGLVEKNAYVASLNWDQRTDAQRKLGWQPTISYDHGVVRVVLRDAQGAPVREVQLRGVIGRPATDRADRRIDFSASDQGYVASIGLTPGAWRLELRSDAPQYRHRLAFTVKGTL